MYTDAISPFAAQFATNVLVWLFATSEVLVVLVFGRAKIVFNPLVGICVMTRTNRNAQIASTLFSFSLLPGVLSQLHLFLLQSSVSVHSPTQRQHCFLDDSRNQSDPSPVCTDICVCYSVGAILYLHHNLSYDSASIPLPSGNGPGYTILKLFKLRNQPLDIWRNESSCP